MLGGLPYFAEGSARHGHLSPVLLYEGDIDNKLWSSSSSMVAFPDGMYGDYLASLFFALGSQPPATIASQLISQLLQRRMTLCASSTGQLGCKSASTPPVLYLVN